MTDLTVFEEETTNGATTGINGRFTLTPAKTSGILKFFRCSETAFMNRAPFFRLVQDVFPAPINLQMVVVGDVNVKAHPFNGRFFIITRSSFKGSYTMTNLKN